MDGWQNIAAERDIARGLSQFARILDSKRWDSLRDVFAETLSFDYGAGGEQEGIPALEAQMRRFLDGCGPTQHLIGSILIDVNGAVAESRAYVQARHQRRDDPLGPIFDTSGEYIDQWSKEDAGWRITRRDVVWFCHHGDPDVISMADPRVS